MSQTRREFLLNAGVLGVGGVVGLSSISNLFGKNFLKGSPLSARKKNVLFIPVDDLRTQLGCFGHSKMISPNIDRLAGRGVIFDRAYCQQPICMATRASLLSGYRPDHANIYSCKSVKELIPDALTINKHFESNGYQLWATGKVYHYPSDHKAQFGNNYHLAKGNWVGRGYVSEEAIKIVSEYSTENENSTDDDTGKQDERRGPAYESPDVLDNAYGDGIQTEMAIEQLEKFSKSDKPFFMAVGYRKPHLPFCAPKKYWDMYNPDDLKLANNPFLPKGATEFTYDNFNELRNYHGIPKDKNPLPDEIAVNIIHGYYACVSYTDAQIGKLLDTLDRLDLTKDTVIVLWGDHGWKLGEHGMWCKHTPFELDAHVPLIISDPDMNMKGERINSMAEFVDIYPTLCALCGIDIPNQLEGDNLVPAIHDPKSEIKQAAFTQWPKSNRENPDKVMTAYSMVTDRYRYIEWTHNKSEKILARELYDHKVDPDENENIVEYADIKEIVEQLSKKLEGGKGWKNFRPKKVVH